MVQLVYVLNPRVQRELGNARLGILPHLWDAAIVRLVPATTDFALARRPPRLPECAIHHVLAARLMMKNAAEDVRVI